MAENVFKDLSQIDVSKHLEEKQGLKYLQWMSCWAMVKDYDSAASYKIHCNEEGNPYFLTNHGAFVKTSVTIKGQTLTEVLPVIDASNKSLKPEAYTYDTKYKEGLKVDSINSFEINSAYKRCLVKTCAMHGLGAQVYINGEGTPLSIEKGLNKKKKAPAKSAPKKKSF